MVTFSDILDEDLLVKIAGDRFFQRGVDYFERGLVSSLAQYEEQITAEVRGTRTYRVNLWLQNAELMFHCNCPVGMDGWFCKHCVAVGLAWIAEPPLSSSGEGPAVKKGMTMEDVRDYLERQECGTLVEIIIARAMEDAPWREKLLMKAASHQPGGADVKTFRRALRKTIPIGDFVDYYGAAGYAEEVQSVIDGLEELLDAGYGSDVIELSEEAITLLEGAMESIDDSDGHLSLIIDQVQEIHYQACQTSQPNPSALAERLFHMELNSGYGFFYNAIESYREILGDEGVATYTKLVDEQWEKLPERGEQNKHSFDYHRSQISRMKENLVAATGNIEELVTVIAKDLSQPSRYLEIAQLYEDDGQIDQAIAWAERGFNGFKNSHLQWQLSDFLIAAYEKQGRFADAINIVWENFHHSPSLSLYHKLKKQAKRLDNWPKWRDKALLHIEQGADDEPQTSYFSRFAETGHSLLVEIFLWEGDVEKAWQKAKSDGCSKNLWMRLAQLREADHPRDAISVYVPEIEPLINQTNNQAYGQAVTLLIKVRDLMKRLDQNVEFNALVNKLSSTYKRKRNFIKLLKKEGFI